jgi:hypothetical protein
MAAVCVYKGEPDAVERVCVFVHLRRGGVTYGGVEGRGTGWGEKMEAEKKGSRNM